MIIALLIFFELLLLLSFYLWACAFINEEIGRYQLKILDVVFNPNLPRFQADEGYRAYVSNIQIFKNLQHGDYTHLANWWLPHIILIWRTYRNGEAELFWSRRIALTILQEIEDSNRNRSIYLMP